MKKLLLVASLVSAPAFAASPCIYFGSFTKCLTSGGIELDNAKQLRFYELNTNGTDYVSLRSPDALAAPYDLILPDAQGTGTLVNDGVGNLSWDSSVGTLPQNYVETLDPLDTSSTRFNIESNIVPSIDSSGSNLTELQVSSFLTGAEPVLGVTSLKINNTNTGSGNESYNYVITADQDVGNGTDPITIDNLSLIQGSGTIAANVTVGDVQGIQWGLSSAAGSTITDYSFVRDISTLDTTGPVSEFEARDNITTLNGNREAFDDNSVLGHVTGTIRSFGIGNTWSQVDGNILALDAAESVPLANGYVLTMNDNQHIGDMPVTNTGYVFADVAPTVTDAGKTVGNITVISSHLTTSGTVRNDVEGWEDSSNFNEVARNINWLNFHPNIAALDSNYNMYTSAPHVTNMRAGNYTDMQLEPNVDALAHDYEGININPHVVESPLAAEDFTVTMVGDVAGSLASKSFVFALPNAAGGTNYTPWYKVSGTGTAPGCCGNLVEVDISTGDSAATVATATYNAVIAVGAPITTNITLTDLGGAVQFVAVAQGTANLVQMQDSGFSYTYATYGAGDGAATGLSINMTQADSFQLGQVHGIQVTSGDLRVNDTYPLRAETNPTSVNFVSTNLTAPASTTIANADDIAFGAGASIQLGHDAHITSGTFGIGSAGTGSINLLQLDDSSTIADAAAAFYAFIPIGGSGAGGVVAMTHGVEIAGLPGSITGSPTTITSSKAFEARAPAGPFTTSHAWGLYAESGYDQNYMAGALKVGAGADTVTTGTTLDVGGSGASSSSAVHISQSGAGIGETIDNSSSQAGIVVNASGAGRAITLTQTGTGDGIRSTINNAANTHEAIAGTTTGTGRGVFGETIGGTGYGVLALRTTSSGHSLGIADGASGGGIQISPVAGTTTTYGLILPGAQGAANTSWFNDGSGNLSWSLINDVNVAAAAAIAGTKISPDFGSQNIVTLGTGSFGDPASSGGSLAIRGNNANLFLGDTGIASIYIDGVQTIQGNASILTLGVGNPQTAIYGGGNTELWVQPGIVKFENVHEKSIQATVPTAAATTNAGTGATCTLTNATDIAGNVELVTTSIAPSLGIVCNITFNVPYAVAPVCTFSPTDTTAALATVTQGIFTTTSTTALSINFTNADIIGRTFDWSYRCIETQ